MHTIETLDVMGSEMEVHVFVPETAGPRPGIVLAQHIPVGHTGIENDTFTLRSAERYAENGYVVVAPFIFHWWPKEAPIDLKREESRDDWTLADMRAGYELLAARDDVDSTRIAVVGHCWGGRVAWMTACDNDAFSACVVFYGGNIKMARGDGPAPITQATNICCPLLGVFGNEDTNPSPADVADYAAALQQAGVEHEFHAYDGAGHGFQDFASPDRYHESASEKAWQVALDFLARHMRAA